MVVVRVSEVSSSDGDLTATAYVNGKSAPLDTVNLISAEQEKNVRWYMEEFVQNPFEVTRAAKVHDDIQQHGRKLASILSETGIIPSRGSLELEIELGPGMSHVDNKSLIQKSHWEILENVSIWPKGFKFDSVTVKRTICIGNPKLGSKNISNETNGAAAEISVFNILLVISRPKGREDIDYQLVSRLMVDILDRIQTDGDDKGVRVHLTILRPPTWQAFRDHLLVETPPGHYRLVHFDMHGKITTTKSGEARANLRFSRYVDGQDVYATKGLLKSAQDIAVVLNEAKVECVIANACDSASTDHDNTPGNLAEVFIRSGIPFVLAMSYPIIDHAVEIFMHNFYHSLLVRGENAFQAILDGRKALLKSPKRRARFLHEITQTDYFVPLCYQDIDKPAPKIFFGQKRGKMQKFKNKLSISRITGKQAVHRSTSEQHEIVGRDMNILEMEHILKRCQRLLLHGQGSNGKTCLLKYCEWWWKKTGMIEKSYYFDFSNTINKEATFEDILEEIGDLLLLPEESRSEDAIAHNLQPHPILLVFDSVESLTAPGLWQKARFDPEEQQKLWDFLNRVCHGNTFVILSSRLSSLPESVPGLIAYGLTGLSISAAAQLSEQLIQEKAPSMASKLATRENIDFLRRIFILLEGNPEAIKAVLPMLWNSSLSTKELFKQLLVGFIPIEEGISRNSRFLTSIRSVNSELELFASMGGDVVVFPWQLFPFWNIMPCNLKAFYYFFFFKAGALQRDFAAERPYSYCFTKYFEADTGIVGIISKSDDTSKRILNKLKLAGIISDVCVTYNDGTESNEDFYHVHPLFTLCARAMVLEDFVEPATYAFYRNQSIQGKSALGDPARKIDNLVWDNEVQHSDHHTNNTISALIQSLDADILDESDLHGMAMTDIFLLDLNEGFFHNRRLREILETVVRKHLTRLVTLPLRRGDSIFMRYEASAILSHTHLITKTSEKNELPLVQSALNIGQGFKYESGEDFPPDMEQSWYELQLMKGKYIMEDNPRRGKAEIESVLQTDPVLPPSDGLYGAIRRVFVSLLMEWMVCASTVFIQDRGLDQKASFSAGAKSFGQLFEMGKMENFIRNIHEMGTDKLNVPFQQAFAHIFQHYEKNVAQFGTMAKSILDDPMWKNYRNTPDETVEEYFMRLNQDESLNEDAVNITEYQLRTIAGEGSSARHLMNRILDKQASSSSTGAKDLQSIHLMMYNEAIEQKEWLKAIQHLDEVEKIRMGGWVAPEEQVNQHLRYATCYDGLEQGEECARRVLKGQAILHRSPQDAFLIEVADFKSLRILIAGKNKLSFLEKLKLQKIIKDSLAASGLQSLNSGILNLEGIDRGPQRTTLRD